MSRAEVGGLLMPGDRMAAEMAEQPAVLERLIERRDRLVARIRATAPDPLAGIVIVARGSSDHAGVYGRYALELAARRPVSLVAPSIHTLYRADVDHHGYLAVAISQSGRTPEVGAVLGRLRSAGAVGVAVTNDPASTVALEADVVIDLQAGEELAVPATKTFTSEVLAVALLADALGDPGWSRRDLANVPSWVRTVLSDPGPAAVVASRIGNREDLIAAGRGYAFGVALEAALKLKETASLHAEGYSAADLRHGPIAVLGPGVPLLVFVAPGPTQADMESLVELATRRGSPVYRVSACTGAELPVPDGVPEPLWPVVAAVRAQQLAHALALLRGMDPDAPNGLAKVTPTS